MNLDQLRTFLVVVEQGSFSRAAQALDLGQSTVSFQMRALEDDAGARLLDRGGGRVRLTAAGKLLRRYAERLVALRDEALERLHAEDLAEEGELRLAASTIPAEYLVPRLLARFRPSHPRVRVLVHASDSGGAIASLVTETCDVALVGARPSDRRLVSSPFAEDEIVLVGPRPSPFGLRRAVEPEDLTRVPLVLREEASGTQQAIVKLLARHRLSRDRLAAPIETSSTEAVKRCVLAGLGVAFLSRLAVEDELAAGKLERLAFPGTPVRRAFHAVRRRGATLPAAAAAFLRLVHHDHKSR
jgi:DNA-binding transcriptional LysR family regulator